MHAHIPPGCLHLWSTHTVNAVMCYLPFIVHVYVHCVVTTVIIPAHNPAHLSTQLVTNHDSYYAIMTQCMNTTYQVHLFYVPPMWWQVSEGISKKGNFKFQKIVHMHPRHFKIGTSKDREVALVKPICSHSPASLRLPMHLKPVSLKLGHSWSQSRPACNSKLDYELHDALSNITNVVPTLSSTLLNSTHASFIPSLEAVTLTQLYLDQLRLGPHLWLGMWTRVKLLMGCQLLCCWGLRGDTLWTPLH